jgi:1-phosphofructokinase family hexose kinase
MLLALTTNPAIDRTLVVLGFRHAEVTRVSRRSDAAGGKGLNVARVARTLGLASLACAPLAGINGRTIAELANREGIPSRWHWMASGESRICILITDPEAHDSLVINEQGPPMEPAEWEAFAQLVLEAGAEAAAISFSGSLMPGVPPERLRDLATELLAGGRTVYIDTSGAPLRAVLDLPLPLLKVNAHELGDALGQPIAGLADAVAAAEAACARGPHAVVVTLGKDGAIGVDRHGAWHAKTPPIQVVSPVGSGDAVLAGVASVLLAGGELPEALRAGVAAGAANALTLGGGVVRPADLDYLLAESSVVNL